MCYWLEVTFHHLIGLVSNGPGDLDSIPARVIAKTLKMVIDISLLNTHHYKIRIKSKVEQSRERSSALRTLQCSSYWKGSLRVTLDYGLRLYSCKVMQGGVGGRETYRQSGKGATRWLEYRTNYLIGGVEDMVKTTESTNGVEFIYRNV